MRHLIRSVVAVLVVAALAACQAPAGDVSGWRWGVVTFDDNNFYGVTGGPSSVTLSAATSNTSGNLRFIGARHGAPISTNHTSCATWTGDTSTHIQPGVSVRSHISDGRRRAITLTNNVYFGARGLWNVHFADSDSAIPMLGLGSFDFSSALGGLRSSEVNPPWRFCLRATGTVVTAKVWPAGISEPSWSDPQYAKSLSVPSNYVLAGQPGWYMGHLLPGESATLTGL